jgi:AraC-like DNA-binding protein
VNPAQSLISVFMLGLAAGSTAVLAVAIARSRLGPNIRLASLLWSLSMIAWLVTEPRPLWLALGQPFPFLVLAWPVAGLFWLYVLTIFADWKVTPVTLAPAGLMLLAGFAQDRVPGELQDLIWAARNLFAGVLAVHAVAVIARGWSDDLVERRRRYRALILALACLFVMVEVGAAFLFRLDPERPWLALTVGHPIGSAMVALLVLAMSAVALQVQPSIFGAARRAEAVPDGRAEAADRQLVARLEALMTAEGWRREGLTIGALAAELDTPEHRLRRLINQRLGHRNFADFVNGYRIEAAKRRLSDPAEARTTVAAIAFDLGYGSLGPFNRAFRAATGSSPTEWRRQALAASPDLQEAL